MSQLQYAAWSFQLIESSVLNMLSVWHLGVTAAIKVSHAFNQELYAAVHTVMLQTVFKQPQHVDQITAAELTLLEKLLMWFFGG